MKRLVAVVALLLFTSNAWAQSAIDKPTIVQHKQCNAQTPVAQVTTCAFTSNATAGDTVVVFAGTSSATVTHTITSNNGTCTPRKSVTGQSPDSQATDCTVTATAATTITDTISSGSTVTSMEIVETNGASTFDVVEGFHTSSTGTSCVSGDNTPTNTTGSPDLILSACFITGARTQTSGPGAGYTNLDAGTASVSMMTSSSVYGNSAISANRASSTWGWTSAAANTGIVLAYKSNTAAAVTPHGTPTTTAYSLTSSVSPNLPGSTSTGDCIALFFCSTTGVLASPTCTGGGDTWTKVLETTFNTTQSATLFIAPHTSGNTAPTCSLGVTATGQVFALAFSGANGSCATDGTPSGATGNSASPQSPSDAGAKLGDEALLMTCGNSGISGVSGTPLYDLGANAGMNLAIFGYPVTVTATLPAQTHTISSQQWAAQEVLIQPLAATATATATDTATATPTATATATSTATATLTATPTATATSTGATSTPTPIATPTATALPAAGCDSGNFRNREGRRKHIVPGCEPR